MKGVGQVLREQSPNTKTLLCEPANAPLLLSGVKTAYPADGSIADESHPVFRPHLMQGWTPDFVPQMAEYATQNGLYDELSHVSGDEAISAARELAASEGIFTGTSGGGILACALRKAKSLPDGSTVLALLPDTGERYISTPLFDEVPADMTGEELELFQSVPPTSALPQPLPEATDEARKILSDFISSDKVAIVSMESCEFCWTIFKFLKAINVDHSALSFDSLKYAENNLGNKIRSAVQELTGEKTFPQVFVGGKFIGGAADACIKWKKGELGPILEEVGAKPDENWNGYTGDPFEFLPKWMTKNPLRSK